jgi:cold shock CspA family protein
MQIPLEITCRNVHKSDQLVELIQKKVNSLEKVCDYITQCNVVIEKPLRHGDVGNPYQVRLDITVPPGHKIEVVKEPNKTEFRDPLYATVRNAFDAARRQLQKLVELQRGEVKAHIEPDDEGIVVKLFDDYGFLESLTGRDIYFHKNSVVNHDFVRLEIGTAVRFVEEMGEDGPQASTVRIVDKPGSRISNNQ